VGDPLCAVAGWLKLPFWPCVAYMASASSLRYVTMTAALLWVFPGQFTRLRQSLLCRARSVAATRTPPMTHPHPAYDDLSATWKRMHHLGHLQSIAGWDQAANMPPKGNEARAAALAEMAALLHRMRTDPQLPDRSRAPSRSR
jgi:hypothetical protein